MRDGEREAQAESDVIIASSNAVREEVIRVYGTPPERIATIYDGVTPRRAEGGSDQGEARRRRGVGTEDPVVLLFGDTVCQPGITILLDVVPLVRQEWPQARFIIVNDGKRRPGLAARYDMPDADRADHALTRRSGWDLIEACHYADVVCVAGRHEPFGSAVLEAWTAGTPVIAAMEGEGKEFVWHGVTGLSGPGDPPAIAEAIESLLANERRARWLGRNGRVAAQTAFSWDHVAERVRRVYEEGCGQHIGHVQGPRRPPPSTKEEPHEHAIGRDRPS